MAITSFNLVTKGKQSGPASSLLKFFCFLASTQMGHPSPAGVVSLHRRHSDSGPAHEHECGHCGTNERQQQQSQLSGILSDRKGEVLHSEQPLLGLLLNATDEWLSIQSLWSKAASTSHHGGHLFDQHCHAHGAGLGRLAAVVRSAFCSGSSHGRHVALPVHPPGQMVSEARGKPPGWRNGNGSGCWHHFGLRHERNSGCFASGLAQFVLHTRWAMENCPFY